MKVAVFGLGYVGLANALLLARHEDVYAYDIQYDKIAQLQQGISPLEDKEIEKALQDDTLNINFTHDPVSAIAHAECVIIATPTDYDVTRHSFNTRHVEQVIEQVLKINPKTVMLIKSTVPVGYTASIKARYQTDQIIFSPEFLREGHALYDNLYPSRIIIGECSARGEQLANMFLRNCCDEKTPILLTDSTEAEAIKLFSNTYLALRVAYFNELDTYAALYDLNTRHIVEGVCLDPRIGMHYNNPSFGYGGYCLPKDTKQLRANYEHVPHDLISAIVEANDTRKAFIVSELLKLGVTRIGIYRLTMKAGSDNFRYAAIHDIITALKESADIELQIYEPTLTECMQFEGIAVSHDWEAFLAWSEVIVANRIDERLYPYQDKVYTRDIFGIDE